MPASVSVGAALDPFGTIYLPALAAMLTTHRHPDRLGLLLHDLTQATPGA